MPDTDFTPALDEFHAKRSTTQQRDVLEKKELEILRSVFEAAFGLCMGYDWNNGTAAIDCGYRRKLLSAVNAIREVPDFEHKYRSAGRSDLSQGQ